MNTAETFDFIVTGAGSAGCAVAGRLSESGDYRVLLLEAGGRDSNPWIHVPLGYTKTFTDPKVNWMFDSEPEAQLNGRVLYQPRGKVLGGTSSINGMVYMRGTSTDYDGWRQRGCEGRSYDDVLPFLKKAEDQERGADDFHGTGGPLHVSNPVRCPLGDAMVQASLEAGIQSRFQRRPSGGRRLLPDDDDKSPPLEFGARLSQRRQTPPKPDRRDRGARHPRPVRSGPRGRRRIPYAAGQPDCLCQG
jgi:choline dehydrogenase-like flavoprotein